MIRFNTLEPEKLPIQDRLLSGPSKVETPVSSLPIRIGAYIENIYIFSADHKTFDADGWIWLIWPEPIQNFLESRRIAPDKLLNFVNQINDWDFNLEPLHEHPIRQNDGSYYQKFKFSGHFYANDLNFRKYPFQNLKLPLVFELAEIEQTPDMPAMHLAPAATASGVGAYIDIMGYKTTAFNIVTASHEYATHFGLEDAEAPSIQTRQISFVTTYRQSINAALLTLFLPLVTVMALVLFAPLLSASLWDIRLGIPPTALLTLIFLQQSYRDKLPQLPYATYLDMIYNSCYLVNLIMFGLFLWGSNRLYYAADSEKRRSLP